MKYGVITSAAASAALILSGPLAAQEMGKGKQTREQARQNSEGPDNANERGIERSNENSVLKGGQSGGTDMRNKRGNNQAGNASDRARTRANQNSAVQAGMMVHGEDGKMLGRVKDVKRSPDGTIIAIVVILVVQINGTTQITLTPEQFKIVAGVIVAIGITVPTGS